MLRRCVQSVGAAEAQEDLDQLGAWIVGGMQVPVESRFPVRELGAALARLAKGSLCGRIAIQVDGGF